MGSFIMICIAVITALLIPACMGYEIGRAVERGRINNVAAERRRNKNDK